MLEHLSMLDRYLNGHDLVLTNGQGEEVHRVCKVKLEGHLPRYLVNPKGSVTDTEYILREGYKSLAEAAARILMYYAE